MRIIKPFTKFTAYASHLEFRYLSNNRIKTIYVGYPQGIKIDKDIKTVDDMRIESSWFGLWNILVINQDLYDAFELMKKENEKG